MNPLSSTTIELAQNIKLWAKQAGFQDVRITDCDLSHSSERYQNWIKQKFNGSMSYMERNIDKRFQPNLLVENTISIIALRMDYLPHETNNPKDLLNKPNQAYISRYALGRDYHKVIRKRLQKLATRIQQDIGDFGYRAFTDSAPVLEKPIAAKAGIGWVGKHSNILNKHDGSWFFLGEIYIDIDLPKDDAIEAHCGNCTSCIDVCPTQAIIEPYIVDARKCISYLTIENKTAIPIEYRQAMGNRIYGCDDCQLFCPWNKFAQHTEEVDFNIRHSLDNISLIDCFNWDEAMFLQKMEGSPIRRIGYQSWIRNCAVALGNAPFSESIQLALKNKPIDNNELLQEHINWASKENYSHQKLPPESSDEP